MRKRPPIQHVDTYLCGGGVVVHNHLVLEIGIVILGIQLQRLLAHGDIERRRHTAVPSLLHGQIPCHRDIAARSQQVVVLCPGVRRPVAFTRREAQRHHIRGHPLHMQPWRDKGTVQAAPVCPQARHHRQPVRRLVGVFGIHSRHHLGLLVYQKIHANDGIRQPCRTHPLVLPLSQQAEPCRQLMMLVELMLQHQPRIQIPVFRGIGTLAKFPVQVIEAPCGHQCQVGVMLVIQQHSVLHIGLIAVCIELHTERIVQNTPHLSSLAVLTHHAHTTVKDIAAVHILPPVLHMPLADSGRIMPAVLVPVVVHPIFLAVQQQLGAQVLVQMQVDHRIALGLQAAVGIKVHIHPRFSVGLLILHINLSSDALKTALHTRSPLAHRDAVHPCTRHIVQLVRSGGTRKAGQILNHHLHILAAQAQQFNLTGTHSGIAVVHIHTGIGHKALAQIAAGSAEQHLLPHLRTVLGTAQTAQPLGLRAHAHLGQCLFLINCVLSLSIGTQRHAQQQTI